MHCAGFVFFVLVDVKKYFAQSREGAFLTYSAWCDVIPFVVG
jgi:hypothetical protein